MAARPTPPDRPTSLGRPKPSAKGPTPDAAPGGPPRASDPLPLSSDPEVLAPDPEVLVQIARMKMPFGRYAGARLIDLPEPYLVWFRNKGFPRGRLGELLATLYEIKANGLEPLLAPLRDPSDPRYRDTDPRDFREGDR